MGKYDTTLYISEDVYYKLPEAEQEKFESFCRYRDDIKGDEWSDEVFEDEIDLMKFWGTEHSCYATGSCYERTYKKFTPEDEKYWKQKGQEICSKMDLEGAPCDPIRIRYRDRRVGDFIK